MLNISKLVMMIPNKQLDLNGSSLRSYAKRKPAWRAWLYKGKVIPVSAVLALGMTGAIAAVGRAP